MSLYESVAVAEPVMPVYLLNTHTRVEGCYGARGKLKLASLPCPMACEARRQGQIPGTHGSNSALFVVWPVSSIVVTTINGSPFHVNETKRGVRGKKKASPKTLQGETRNHVSRGCEKNPSPATEFLKLILLQLRLRVGADPYTDALRPHRDPNLRAFHATRL